LTLDEKHIDFNFMSAINIAEEIRRLSVDERIRLIGMIWDGIRVDSEPPTLTDAQRAEIARRIAAHEQDPSSAIPVDEVFAEPRKRYG
jgi:putative addiction module component (TIGR02574 family)